MSATATHDVVLNGVGYLVKPGSYRKRSAPLMGARFTTGNPDYSVLGPMQHWVQSSWTGGMDQDAWSDDVMFDEAVGIDTTVHERMQLTRDLTQPVGKGYGVDGLKIPRQFVVFQNVLYLLTSPATGSGQLWKYTVATDSWALFKTFTGSLTWSAAVWQNSLLIGSSADYLHRFDGTTWTTVAFPGGETASVAAMASFRDRLYVSFAGANRVWRLKPDFTWDGTTLFYQCPDSWIVKFEIHLGYLYMLSRAGTIFRTDGNNTGEVWRADFGAAGSSMRSYDGRLFVMLSVTDEGGSQCESALYQLSGSAMTELKRWGSPGKIVTYNGQMIVTGGRMYYGASGLLGMADGFGVAVYDAVEDAHSIFCSSRDMTSYPINTGTGSTWTVDDVCLYGDRLFIVVRGYGVFRTPFTFKNYAAGRATATYDVTGAPYGGGWLTSSVYDAGTPGLTKMWTSVLVDVQIPAAGGEIWIDASLNGGTTWTTNLYGQVFNVNELGRSRHRSYLPGWRSLSLCYRVRLKSTSSASTPVVYAVSFSYVPLPDPQWQWEMTLVLSEMQELLDGTTVTVDPGAELVALEALYRSNVLVTFIDIAGTVWPSGTIFTDLSEVVYLTSTPVEGEVRIVLLEALEN